ncbi:Teneurin-1 [Aphelenchoides fujianensis]|nr:Teneurin-1 [Aphelenchoides fujianensis]
MRPPPPAISPPRPPQQPMNFYEIPRSVTPQDPVVIHLGSSPPIRTAHSYGTLWGGAATTHRHPVETRCINRCTASIVPDRRSLIREAPMGHHDPSAFLMGHSSSGGSQDDPPHCFASSCTYRNNPSTRSKLAPERSRSWLFNERTAVFFFVSSVILLLALLVLFLFNGNLSYVYSKNGLIAGFSPSFPLEIGGSTEVELPPRRFVYSDFTVNHNTNVTLLFNISDPEARFVVYARQTLPPTPSAYDFRRIVTADHIHLRSGRRRRGAVDDEYREHFEESPMRNGLVVFEARAGHWLVGFLNDGTRALPLTITALNSVPEGDDSLAGCRFDCFGKGSCVNNRCACYPGFTGRFCQETSCPVLCSGNGVFSNGQCLCHAGFKGPSCEQSAHACSVPNCNSHGTCDVLQGRCVCDHGWTGESCEQQDCIDPQCSQNGECHAGQCLCRSGFWGANCEKEIQLGGPEALRANHTAATVHSNSTNKEDDAPADLLATPVLDDTHADAKCNFRGEWNDEEKHCVCSTEYSGEFCDQLKCTPSCIHGQCVRGMCLCNEGWIGQTCDRKNCPDACNQRGSCSNGTCVCSIGWNGESCEQLGCKNGCNGNGDCQLVGREYKCFCKSSFFGSDCEFALEGMCDDGIDNDGDGLTDCEDSECCGASACRENPLCMGESDDVQYPQRVPSRPHFRFNNRIKFLMGPNPVNSYANLSSFDERRISVIRGRIFSQKGGPLTGVRVSDAVKKKKQIGFTMTRSSEGGGSFNFVVNGGGFIRLRLLRLPFATIEKTFFVPPNEIVNIERVFIDEPNDSPLSNSSSATKPTESCRSAHIAHRFELKAVPAWKLRSEDCRPSSLGNPHLSPISRTLETRAAIDGVENIQLVYNNDRSDSTSALLYVRLLSRSAPMRRVHLKISMAGRIFTRTFTAKPHLQYTFDWDRKDVYGQDVLGLTDVEIRAGYEYEECGGLADSSMVWQVERTQLEGRPWFPTSFGLWTLSVQHAYNPVHNILEMGDGKRVFLDEQPAIVQTILGGQQRRALQCADCSSQPAPNVALYAPLAVVSMPDGSLIVGDYNLVRRLSADRSHVDLLLVLPLEAVERGYHLALDSATEKVYVSLPLKHQVYRIEKMDAVRNPKENFEVVAGNGEKCESATDCSSGGNVARSAKFGDLRGMSFDRDSGFYLIDGLSIRYVNRDGRLFNLVTANNWRWKEDCPTSFRLELLNLEQPLSLLVEPHTQDLIVLDMRAIYRIDVRLSTVRLIAGQMHNCDRQQLISSSLLHHPQAIALNARTNQLYVVEADGKRVHQIRRVSANGGPLIHVAGRLGNCDCGEKSCQCDDPTGDPRVAANDAFFHNPAAITLDLHSGHLFVADRENYKLKSVEVPRPQFDKHQGTYTIASSADDQQFVFDRNGRHVKTKNALTGQTLYQFAYSADDRRLVNLQLPNRANLTISTVGSDITLQSSNSRQTVLSMSSTNEDESPQLNAISTPWSGVRWTFGFQEGQLINTIVDRKQRYHVTFDSTGHATALSVLPGNRTTSLSPVQFEESGPLAMGVLQNGEEIATWTVNENNLNVKGDCPLHFLKTSTGFMLNRSGYREVVDDTSSSADGDPSGVVRRKVVLPADDFQRLGESSYRFELKSTAQRGSTQRSLEMNGVRLFSASYDQVKRLGRIESADGSPLIAAKYDRNNQIVFAQFGDQRDAQLNLTYNSIGQLQTAVWAGRTLVRMFDKNHRLVRETIEAGDSQEGRSFTYTDSNLPFPVEVRDDSGVEHGLVFGEGGRLQSIRMPSKRIHSFEVDERTITRRRPSGRAFSLKLDADGNKRRFVTASKKEVRWQHDDGGRLRRLRTGDSDLSFEYGRFGKLIHSNSSAMSNDFYWHGPFLVGAEYSTTSTSGYPLSSKASHQYDDFARLRRLQFAFNKTEGMTTTYAYENDGRLSSINNVQIKIEGRKIAITHPAFSMDLQLNADRRLTSVQYSNKISSAQAEASFSFDPLGRVVEKKWTVGNSSSSERVAYAKGGRLTSFSNGHFERSIEHDGDGRVNQVGNQTVEYNEDDAILSLGDRSYEVDENGWVKKRDGLEFTYDAAGQLVRVKSEDGAMDVRYEYDERQRLIQRKNVATSTDSFFFYALPESPRLVSHFVNERGDLFAIHYVDQQPILLESRNGTLFTLLAEQSSNVYFVFDPNGHVLESRQFGPFGSRHSSTSMLPLGLGGHIDDPEVGVRFVHGGEWTRPLDVNSGRFQSFSPNSLESEVDLVDLEKVVDLYRFEPQQLSQNVPLNVAEWKRLAGIRPLPFAQQAEDEKTAACSAGRLLSQFDQLTAKFTAGDLNFQLIAPVLV